MIKGNRSCDVNTVSCTYDRNLFASGGDEGLIKLWDRRTFSNNCMPIGCFIGHQKGIVSIDHQKS